MAFIFLVVFILFIALVLPSQAAEAEKYSNELGSPDTNFFYAPDELFTIAEGYGPQGRVEYVQARFSFDLIFPLVYGGFLVTAISWLLVSSLSLGNRLVGLNLVPVFGVLFDLLENIFASIVMVIYPTRLGWLAVLSAGFSGIKWVLVYGSFGIALVAAGIWLFTRIKKAKNGK